MHDFLQKTVKAREESSILLPRLRSFNQIMLGQVAGAAPARFPAVSGDEWLERALAGRTPVGLFGGCEAWQKQIDLI